MRRVALALLVLLVLPSTVRAVETPSVQSLLEQLSILQSALTQLKNGSGSCTVFSQPLRVGSSGAEVIRLQQFLARDAAIYPEADISGYYGPLTTAAVRRFQVVHGIVTSGTPETTGFGIVGAKTLTALTSSACPAPTASESKPPLVQGISATVSNINAIIPAEGAAPAGIPQKQATPKAVSVAPKPTVAPSNSAAASDSSLDELAALVAGAQVPSNSSAVPEMSSSPTILSLLSALGSNTGSQPASTTAPVVSGPNGSCKTSWGSQFVSSGQQITYEPFFTGGSYTGATVNLLMECRAGVWFKCDMIGDHCVAFSQ